eukprot:gene4359-6750_t
MADAPPGADELHVEGKRCLAAGDGEEALNKLLRAVRLRVAEDPEGFLVATLYDDAARAHELIGNDANALDLYGKARAIKERYGKGDKPPVDGATFIAAGNLCQAAGELRKALDFYTKALEAQKGGDHLPPTLLLADTHFLAGEVLLLLGRVGEAVEHHRLALAIRRSLCDPANPTIPASHLALGHVLALKGESSLALSHYTQALPALEPVPSPDLFNALTAIGSLNLKEGNPEAALLHYRKALSLAEQFGSSS